MESNSNVPDVQPSIELQVTESLVALIKKVTAEAVDASVRTFIENLMEDFEILTANNMEQALEDAGVITTDSFDRVLEDAGVMMAGEFSDYLADSDVVTASDISSYMEDARDTSSVLDLAHDQLVSLPRMHADRCNLGLAFEEAVLRVVDGVISGDLPEAQRRLADYLDTRTVQMQPQPQPQVRPWWMRLVDCITALKSTGK